MKNRKKQFAVIGLGRFGSSLIIELVAMGHEVLAIDTDEEKIEDFVDIATHAVQADSTDVNVLRKLGITNFDVVVVSIGQNLQANILTAITLKEMGVKKVIAKAQTALHGKVLEKIGTDVVIYPERDMAIKLAHSFVHNVMNQIDLSSEYSIVEILAPKEFVGKSLAQMEVRTKMNVAVIAIKHNDEIGVPPDPDQIIHERDILVVAGENKNINKISEMSE
ncbi:MAG: TrkA family potassium uptake protein [Syntrophomonadaceae bacterium]|jgi:trk system potassium uptake protein TrkA|nr:TrkA family potassium uptake protein [Syntrophomonadaceae bacterium]